MCCVDLALDRLLCTLLGSKGFFLLDVPAGPRVGVCVPLALGLQYFQCFNALISLLLALSDSGYNLSNNDKIN